MPQQWIVVADAARARIFSSTSDAGPLQELEDLVNPGGRMRDRELNSDRPGRAFESTGEGRSGYEPEVSASEQQALVFARQLADRIDQGRNNGDFDRLVLAATPRFLGQLRQALSKPAQKLVRLTVDKNLVQMDEPGIREQLATATEQQKG